MGNLQKQMELRGFKTPADRKKALESDATYHEFKGKLAALDKIKQYQKDNPSPSKQLDGAIPKVKLEK